MTRLRFLLLAPLLLVPPAASGQQQRQGLGGFNSNAPVDVDAGRIEVQDRADRAIFSGGVVATQGNMRMTSARLTVFYTNTGGVDIQRLVAEGGVTMRTPGETAQGGTAIYDVNRRIVTMIGNVHLTQGQNRVQGGRLVLDLNSHRAVMDGGGSGGRVRGRFTVPQRATGTSSTTNN